MKRTIWSQRRLERWWALLGMPLTVVSVLAGCGPATSNAPAGETVAHVLLISALSGPFAPNAIAAVDGVKAGVNFVNKHGGFNGARVELTIMNDNSNPSVALANLKEALANGPKPMWVYAGWTSDEALAMMPLLTTKKILSLETTGAAKLADASAYPYQFNISQKPQDTYGFYVKFFQDKNIKKLGLLAGNDAYGTTVQAAYQDAFKGSGISITIAPYNFTSLTLTPQLQQLKNAGVDAVLVDSEGPTAAYVLKDIDAMGWSIPLYGDSTSCIVNMVAFVPLSLLSRGKWVCSALAEYNPSNETQAVKDMRAHLAEVGATLKYPLTLAANGWDDVMIMKYMTDKAKSFNSDDLVKAMTTYEVPGSLLAGATGGSKWGKTEHWNISPPAPLHVLAPITGYKDGQYVTTASQ